ncbi:MAG: flagellar assembly protein FliW [Fimbriimonadaceae bacterium]|nr:flagellar assembly protein FliW [Fimbriimonadaceae bacterium]QYK57472.1 MAG: flagellar assembly protein FliW [Fimbriimonadaceae bacterium]
MTSVTVLTTRFGEVACAEEDIVTFPEGLVGFSELKRFVLVRHGDDSEFRWLQSLDDGTVAFLVVDPSVYVENYAPDMPAHIENSLAIDEETPILVYTVCTIPNGQPKAMTMNLAGPIVVNAASRRAMQVVLEDERYPVRFPAFRIESDAA